MVNSSEGGVVHGDESAVRGVMMKATAPKSGGSSELPKGDILVKLSGSLDPLLSH